MDQFRDGEAPSDGRGNAAQRQAAAQGADNAHGERATQAEGIPKGQSPLPYLDLVGIAKLYRNQRALRGVHMDHCQITVRIGANQACTHDRAVGKRDLDVLSVFDHVVVGDNVPLSIQHKARPYTLLVLVVVVLSPGHIGQAQAGVVHALNHSDVDHRRVQALVDVDQQGLLRVALFHHMRSWRCRRDGGHGSRRTRDARLSSPGPQAARATHDTQGHHPQNDDESPPLDVLDHSDAPLIPTCPQRSELRKQFFLLGT